MKNSTIGIDLNYGMKRYPQYKKKLHNDIKVGPKTLTAILSSPYKAVWYITSSPV